MQITDKLLHISTGRIASVSRTTKETDVHVSLNLDGQGNCHADTGVPFLDHMLHQIASHGLIDLEVKATGDLEIDDHHTNVRCVASLITVANAGWGVYTAVARTANVCIFSHHVFMCGKGGYLTF